MAGEVNPMPPFPERDVFHLALVGSYGQQMTVTNFHYQGEKGLGLSSDADMAALIAAFTKPGSVMDAYASCCVLTWLGVVLRCDMPTMPEVVTMEFGLTNIVGLASGGGLPGHSAVTIARQGDTRGKHGRGRISVPAVSRDVTSGSLLTSPGSHQVLAGKMFDTLSDANHSWRPGIWAKKRMPGTVPTQYEYGFAPLISTLVRVTLGTCRRRKPGVGQ